MDVGVSVSFFKNELGSTIELAVQAAVETVLCEIAKVVGTKLVGLQVEIAETLNENQTLKRRLKRTETELKSVREREKTTRAKTSNTISNKRHAPHFTEQLGVPSWANINNNNHSPAFVPQSKDRGLNVDEPCVSFLGDQVTEAGTEYNAAGFAHCLPILINRDCDTQGASLADPETSHLIIQEDGTDRSVSIRDDAFQRIDDIWGGGGATDAGTVNQLSYPSPSSMETRYIKEEISQIELITIKEEIPGLNPDPCDEEARSASADRRSDAASSFQASNPSPEINHAFTADEFAVQRRLQIPEGDLPNTCSECGASFRYSSSLKRHQRIHTAEKPFHCTTCSKSFKTGGNLRTHQQVHRGKKPYHCHECGSAFKELLHLEKHRRVHTRETPYRCHVCRKSFIRLGTLHIHQRIHTGEKPYHCTECGKSFRHSDCLKKHLRIHTGEKPYRCAECGESFSRLDYLKKHQQVHKGN
ncbi:UNVERIFIED_CONTAM: hypothetical protein FKN15_072161 [Acipenser sinensis]